MSPHHRCAVRDLEPVTRPHRLSNRGKAPRVTRWQARALAGCALSLASTACGSDTEGSSVRSGPASDEAADYGPLAVVDGTDGREARIEGDLVITDECVFLEHPGTGERTLLIWPRERTRWNDGVISFDSPRTGSRELASGDRVAFGGGGSSEAEDGGSFEEWAARISWVQAPNDACSSRSRWSIGDWSEPSGDEDPDAGSMGPCEGIDLKVPTPSLHAGGRKVELDYLWTQHSCGFNGDGAANLGAELKVIVAGERAQLAVDPRFEAQLALRPDGVPADEFIEAPRSDNDLITVGPLPAPCTELTVNLVDGELSASFAARLARADGDCA